MRRDRSRWNSSASRERACGSFLVDLPVRCRGRARDATVGRDLLLVNVSAPDDELRGAAARLICCMSMPSRAMLTDALAQYAASSGGRTILALLDGPPRDADAGRVLRPAATRFGGRDRGRAFVATNDPRQRDQNNIRALDPGPEYDAVFVADTLGEFGRYFPYQVALPRPVIGSVGLVPDAWHWASSARRTAAQPTLRAPRRATDDELRLGGLGRRPSAH